VKLNITSYAGTDKIQEVEEGKENSQASGRGGKDLGRSHRYQRNNRVHTLIDHDCASDSSSLQDNRGHPPANIHETRGNQMTFQENQDSVNLKRTFNKNKAQNPLSSFVND
jgi:hypothetical protein